MSSPTEFKKFKKLPPELRRMVWKLVEQPVRLIGQVPCSNCWSMFLNRGPEHKRRGARRRCYECRHPDWKLRCIVHPRTQVIFPPLHACRESRAVWLPRYVQPPRYWTPSSLPDSIMVRFDVPFISYEADIFAVFDAWGSSRTLETHDDGQPQADVDPFGGLDRKRIRHVGFCENVERLLQASLALDIVSLPALETLSLIALGPVPKSEEARAPKKLFQMTAAQAQDFECHVRDLVNPESGSWNFSFFNAWRPRHQFFRLSHEIQAYDFFFRFWKAWVWHMKERGALKEFRRRPLPWEDFRKYVFRLSPSDACVVTPAEPDAVCPLFPTVGCGFGGHSHEEMASWKPSFKMMCRYLCEEEWLGILDGLNVFEPVSSLGEDERLDRLQDFITENYDKFWAQ